jgi:16S rRNA processing protein RimM
VGVVLRPHGVHGDVLVDVRTDVPQRRFRPGARLVASDRDGRARAVTVRVARPHSDAGRLVVGLREVTDRTEAATLSGASLHAHVPAADTAEEPDTYFDHQLVGLVVRDRQGTRLGEVVDVLHAPAQDLLVVERPTGGQVLVPFVHAIVPVVDTVAGQLTVDPPGGLFEEES